MRRDPEPEQMDAFDVDSDELRRSLVFIRRINKMLRYNAATRHAVKGLGGGSVLDVCCGSADFDDGSPGYVGLDFHEGTLGIAREWRPTATLVRGDALTLPFADGSFDVSVCQMALHHFSTGQAMRILGEMERVSRRGWVAADLLRRRRASAWIRLFPLAAGPMVKHDARLSVRQAWSVDEASDLAEHFGAAFKVTFGHRFLLVRSTPGTPGKGLLAKPQD